MQESVPTWHRDAMERGINFIVLLYEKAEGSVFCPSDLEHPFRMGGDGGGSYPSGAEQTLIYFNNRFNPAFLGHVKWFVPFLEEAARAKTSRFAT